ncbi:hypothetical protein BH11PLA2_BH11PLA2_01190 [soil metagenome]
MIGAEPTSGGAAGRGGDIGSTLSFVAIGDIDGVRMSGVACDVLGSVGTPRGGVFNPGPAGGKFTGGGGVIAAPPVTPVAFGVEFMFTTGGVVAGAAVVDLAVAGGV